jgi:hypothetical protein
MVRTIPIPEFDWNATKTLLKIFIRTSATDLSQHSYRCPTPHGFSLAFLA